MSDEADDLIRELNLRPHPEGGHFREVFRDVRGADNRARSTAIYFLLHEGETSHWHRIDVCEVWHWYRGAPLALSIAPGRGAPVEHILGNDTPPVSGLSSLFPSEPGKARARWAAIRSQAARWRRDLISTDSNSRPMASFRPSTSVHDRHRQDLAKGTRDAA